MGDIPAILGQFFIYGYHLPYDFREIWASQLRQPHGHEVRGRWLYCQYPLGGLVVFL